ncbi:hypothetical protein CYMTET_47678 [Cymbomonas tetramitiformis]|uniref:Transmembrane protein n=1 Tax=Cymbomonas tetramitiformis TaxID=36881 RepID=A0AAE0BTP2_9CHLO|nr:hypothetical protein CYMTET_47678 [Cymbomonas tetramitiformis]
MSEKRQQPTTSLLESLRGYERHAVLGLLFLGVTLLFLAFPFSTTNLFNESCGADCMAHKRQLLQDELNVEVTPAARPLTIEEKVERWPSKESWPTEAEMAIPVERTKVQDHHLPDGGSGSEERDVPTAGRFRGKREVCTRRQSNTMCDYLGWFAGVDMTFKDGVAGEWVDGGGDGVVGESTQGI